MNQDKGRHRIVKWTINEDERHIIVTECLPSRNRYRISTIFPFHYPMTRLTEGVVEEKVLHFMLEVCSGFLLITSPYKSPYLSSSYYRQREINTHSHFPRLLGGQINHPISWSTVSSDELWTPKSSCCQRNAQVAAATNGGPLGESNLFWFIQQELIFGQFMCLQILCPKLA